jgi:uncharacterized protein DUF2800
MSEEKFHHPFSPSKLQSLEFCPCYASRSTEHIKAAIGTLQHKVTETRQDDMRLSDDEAAAAAECLDFVERKKTELNEEREAAIKILTAQLHQSHPDFVTVPDARRGAEQRIPHVLELTEVYLPVDKRVFEWAGKSYDGTTGGWLDRTLISYDRKRAIACDWKFGLWPVDKAENNLQGMAYALGIFLAYPTVESVTFYFKQPHLNLLTHATWSRADIPTLYTRIVAVVERAVLAQSGEEPKWGMANAGYPTCSFCANIGRCHVVHRFALQVSKKFWPAGVPDDITPTSVTSPTEARARLHLAGILDVWCKAIRRQETDLTLRSGRVPTGYKVDSRTPRQIVDTKAFKTVALQHLTADEYDATMTPEFGKVEDMVKDKAPRGLKKAALEALDKAWREAGAVKDGQPYSFLRAVASDESETTNNQTEKHKA